MRVAVLGPLRVTSDDGTPREVRGKRLRVLLSRLALDAGRVVPVPALVDALWPDDPPADASAALQSLVSRLRRAIGAGAVSSHPAGYRLDAEVDAAEFARLVARRDYGGALALWRGPAFQDGPPEAAARWEDLRLTAVERQPDPDLAQLQRLCAEHPAREGLHARLVRALHAAGRRADALAAFHRVRAHLADELGVDPGPELREAHLVALREDAPRHALPAALGPLIGREDDLARITSLDSRLVTVTGFGGVGKTRLALAAARRCADPVVWVPLDAVPSGVEAAALLALGGGDPGGPVLGERPADLVDRLRGSRCLLVLDNCEHVVEEAAALVQRLLTAAPDVRVLATSREPLGVPGEALHPLAPLDVAGAAVELFAARAAAVRPGFAVDDDVLRVCRALDGIPLALELAAARLRSLTPAQLAERVDQRLRLLDRGPRAGAARHRTLRAVVDWSWELLDGPERDLLARLAVFAGGATADAVAHVAGLDSWTALDLLSSLVDKSLVVVGPDARYRLLETVREYAAGRLAAPEPVRAAHAGWFLGLAERAEPLLRTAAQQPWVAALDVERANLDAALAYFVEVGDGPRALRLLAARTWWWVVIRGRPDAARAAALAVREVATDPLCELLAVGRATDELWRSDRPVVLCALTQAIDERRERARELAERLAAKDDPWLRSAGEMLRGLVAFEFSSGRAVAAEEHYRAALAGFAGVGDSWALAFCHACLSVVLANRGAAEEALEALLRSRDHAERFGPLEDLLAPPAPLVQLGRLRARTGDLAGARRDLDRAAEVARRRGDPVELARVALARGELAWHGGDAEEAVRCFRGALATAPADAPPQFLATVHSTLGLALPVAEAEAEHRLAVRIAESTPDGPARAVVWENRARWHHRRGDRAGAVAALAAAESARGVLAVADPAVAATVAWAMPER